MYSRGSNNGYGQDQPYPSQLPYASQSFGAAAMMGGVDGRAPAAVTVPPLQRYGGEYGSVYGSATQQGSATAAFEGRSNYGSSMHESPKFGANDYISSSSRGYGQQVDKLYSERTSEYPSVERRQYGDHHIAYPGRDKPSETTHRYADSVAIGHEHQSKLYDDLEQATSRQEMLNARALQSVSIEGEARQADYLASRAAIRHPVQDPIAYGGRLDHELRSLSMLTGQSFMGNHTASILGAAPRGNLDELIYSHDSSTPGYGVNLPPGRNYGIGKGLLSIESDYQTSMLGRVGHLIVNDRNNGRDTYVRDLERRDKLEREIEREREKDRLRERERDRERDRERLREREREQREREREKDRERERERRERDRLDHKRRLELKREPTPVRASRDRQTLSFPKDGRSMRRESPRHDLLNRLHSPVKEKRREYSCKVFPYSFVEAERDYLSLDKRYPRLYISPECSKVVVHWPKGNLQLSLYTPVSFEHDFVEADTTEKKESPSSHPAIDISGPRGQKTVWNAKIILMSGLGQNAQADLSSERTYDDRIPHFCNLLKFAVLRKNNSLMAIGGPWDPVDGGEPSVDESSLVQTALRYANYGANLDLKSCQHWNRFLEIHYDRIGKDGHFSHKEITVLYVPDLSCCLPSLDSWRERWVKYKKAVSEREHLHALAKEVPGDKKEISKDEKKPVHPKDGKAEIVLRKKKETLSSEGPKEGKVKTKVQKKKEEPSNQSGHDNKKERDVGKMKGKTPLVSEEGMEIDKAAESNDVINTEGEKTVSELVPKGNPDGQALVATKTGKKKIIKRIVKRKVAKKKDATEKVGATEGSCIVIPNAEGKLDGPSSNPSPLNSLVKKRFVTKIVKAALEKDENSIREVKSEKEPESSAAFNEEVKEEDSNVVTQEVVSTKTTVKKKVVKRVPKRKATSPADKVVEDDLKGEKITQPESIKREQNEEAVDNQLMDISSKSSDSQKIGPHKKEETKVDEKGISGPSMEIDNSNQNVSSNDARGKSKEKKLTKDEKDEKNRVENESKSKTGKTTKEKKKSDEPPKHPGLILQTKGSKVSNVHSLSLSLDSLLNYTDTDIDESTFELSVFAESFNEMLQYEMGCRIFAFLQKLRIKFVANRNKAKRQREETSQKENENSSSKKRARAGNAKSNADVKSNEIVNKSSEDVKLNNAENKSSEDVENKTENKSSEDEDVENKTEGKSCEDVQSTKVENKMDNAAENTGTEITEVPNQDNEKTIMDEIKSIEQADTAKVEDEIEEDPEEDPEEDEKMSKASPLRSPTKERNNEMEKNAGDSIGQDVPPVIAQNEQQDTAKQASEAITSVSPSSKKKLAKVESKPKEARTVVDKELLQAFRYFDRNRAGYIRVEDLRLIIHNLGRFLSHRDVKELVQSALLESSTGRDDRILYEKLVKVPDVILN